MAKHPSAGKAVKIANGPLKGQYFVVTDYLVNTYQGKKIENIVKAHYDHVRNVKRRGYPLDEEIVCGKLYPQMEYFCVHDKELQVDMKVVEVDKVALELPQNVESLATKRTKKKEKKDDGGKSS